METKRYKKTKNKTCWGLNRTMQYGNFFLLLYIINILSLNRTMQYGNAARKRTK